MECTNKVSSNMKYARNCPQMIDLSKHRCQLPSPRFARGPIPCFRPLFVPVALAPFKPLHHWARTTSHFLLPNMAMPSHGAGAGFDISCLHVQHQAAIGHYVHILCSQTPSPLSLSLLSTVKLVQAVRPVKESSLCPSTYQDTDN